MLSALLFVMYAKPTDCVHTEDSFYIASFKEVKPVEEGVIMYSDT